LVAPEQTIEGVAVGGTLPLDKQTSLTLKA
jgi:hypothetical protein